MAFKVPKVFYEIGIDNWKLVFEHQNLAFKRLDLAFMKLTPGWRLQSCLSFLALKDKKCKKERKLESKKEKKKERKKEKNFGTKVSLSSLCGERQEVTLLSEVQQFPEMRNTILL